MYCSKKLFLVCFSQHTYFTHVVCFQAKITPSIMNQINGDKDFFSSLDSLSIYDGEWKKYCGNTIPPVFISSSNEVLINFRTGNEYGQSGFKMRYNRSSK